MKKFSVMDISLIVFSIAVGLLDLVYSIVSLVSYSKFKADISFIFDGFKAFSIATVIINVILVVVVVAMFILKVSKKQISTQKNNLQ